MTGRVATARKRRPVGFFKGTDMRTLLVPIDGSASGNRAVAHAVDNAQRLGDVRLLLLNVQPTLERGYPGGLLSPEVRERLQQAAQADAAAALALMDTAHLSYEFLVAFGQPAEVITRIAEERGCAGIVMGTRGLSEWANVFLGSTAFRVVQQSTIPVTLIH